MNYNKQKILSNILLFWKTWLGFLLLSCSSPSVPTDAIPTGKLPDIFPDYTGVTIPSNLCPTNFMLPDCDEAATCPSPTAKTTRLSSTRTNGRNCARQLPEATKA